MPFIDLPDRIPGLRAQAREPRPWYQFKNVASDEAELFLYDEIGGWGTLAEDFIAELKAITSPKLRVRVSSPGGSVFEGVAVANALRAHSAEVTVQVDSIAASIASVIAMAGDRVVMQPQAMLMVHDASGLCMGNAKDMADMAALLDKISNNIADAYVAKAGGTREEWREVMQGERWYTAEEAVEAGLADEMVPARKQQPDEPEMRRDFDFAAYGYHGPRQPEQPKPTPPPAAEPEKTTLTIDIGSVLGEAFVEQLRASVLAAAEPAAPGAEPETPAVPQAPPADDTAGPDPQPATPSDPDPAPAAEPDNTWADVVAHLTQPDPDPWAELTSHLTAPTASSSAATEAA
jgi:ATP-dependent protease ClpP protease subunit